MTLNIKMLIQCLNLVIFAKSIKSIRIPTFYIIMW